VTCKSNPAYAYTANPARQDRQNCLSYSGQRALAYLANT